MFEESTIELVVLFIIYKTYLFTGFSFVQLLRKITLKTSSEREKLISFYMNTPGYMFSREKAEDSYLEYINEIKLFSHEGIRRMQILKSFFLIPFRS